MEIQKIGKNFSICKVMDYAKVNLDSEYCFIGKTDEEKSLVCLTKDVPSNTIERDDNWRGLRIKGVLDFSLVGILAKIAGLLAEERISIFAVSTFNTDYIFVKKEDEIKAVSCLERAGYRVK